jgi:hypothetical protein
MIISILQNPQMILAGVEVYHPYLVAGFCFLLCGRFQALSGQALSGHVYSGNRNNPGRDLKDQETVKIERRMSEGRLDQY